MEHMHADSILIHPNFSSKLIISQFVRKPIFKVSFQRIHGHVIDKLFENGSKVSSSHVISNFEEKFGWIKSDLASY